MKTTILTLATVSVAALAVSSVSASALSASASTDLNVRSGPGPQFQIVGVIQTGDAVEVSGCLSSQEWCEVNGPAGEGWAYAPYLVFDNAGAPTPLAQMSAGTVVVVEDTAPRDEATMIGAGMGAIAGAIIAGPIGAVAGTMISGIAAHNAVDPEVSVYVQANPVQPVFLSGEAVVGASVPPDVVLYDVPSNQAVAYLNVNGDTVVIDRETRRIIGVVR
ncbi:MAG: DUF1236 domain-containing protein [Rhodobacteraceae bacterium]|nr:DUF1236 domain-containing protein [Paracoccaceae bacterium]